MCNLKRFYLSKVLLCHDFHHAYVHPVAHAGLHLKPRHRTAKHVSSGALNRKRGRGVYLSPIPLKSELKTAEVQRLYFFRPLIVKISTRFVWKI